MYPNLQNKTYQRGTGWARIDGTVKFFGSSPGPFGVSPQRVPDNDPVTIHVSPLVT
jgi:hypothetical protein